MTTETERTLRALVIERPGRARVLEGFGLDYCCGGTTPLGEACRRAGLDPVAVISALTRSDASPTLDFDGAAASLPALIERIVGTHHAFLKAELPRLSALAQKAAAAHGARHPWLHTLVAELGTLRAELEAHLRVEEETLFPSILDGDSVALGRELAALEGEHDEAGAALARFRAMTDGYRAPDDACPTLRALIDGLKRLEADLHEHVHLENNLLFPRARAATA